MCCYECPSLAILQVNTNASMLNSHETHLKEMVNLYYLLEKSVLEQNLKLRKQLGRNLHSFSAR